MGLTREADYSPPTSVEGKETWIYTSTTLTPGVRGSVVVKTLRYKPEGRGFDSR
jgi:hypothetical protein